MRRYRSVRLVSALSVLLAVLAAPASAVTPPEGLLDTSFSDDGLAFADGSASDYSEAYGVAVDTAGRVVVGGYVQGAYGHWGLARFSGDGAPDTSFGADGTAVLELGGDGWVEDVAVDSAGRVLAAGVVSGVPVVVRLTEAGALDPSFDGDGIWEGTLLGGTAPSASFTQVEVTSGDGVLVAGHSSANELLLVVLDATGAFDTAFDGDGWVRRSFGTGLAVRGLDVLSSSGDVVVAGRVDLDGPGPGTLDGFVGRLSSTGAWDEDFGSGPEAGIVTLDRGGSDFFSGVTERSGGGIVVAGERGTTPTESVLVAYRDDGTLDASFGTDGMVVEAIGRRPYDVATDSLGRIVTAGTVRSGGQYWPYVARYLADGRPDSAFGTAGATELSDRPGTSGWFLAVDQHDRLLLAGHSEGLLGVARFTSADAPPPPPPSDTTPPTITVTAPLTGDTFPANPDPWPTYEFSCEDEVGGSGLATCTATRDSGGAEILPGEALDLSSNGHHSFTVTATDGAGNTSTETVGYLVDSEAPIITITSPSGQTVGVRAELIADFTCTDPVSYVVDCLAEVYRNGEWVLTVLSSYPLPTDVEGTYSVVVHTLDGYDNGGQASAGYVVSPAGTNSASATFDTGGGTVSTGDTPTATNPITTSITTTAAGTVTIEEASPSSPGTSGYGFLGEQVNITAPPAASETEPMVFRFRISQSTLDAYGLTADTVTVFRNGEALAPCTSAVGEPLDPQPACVRERTDMEFGAEIVVHTLQASFWNLGYLAVACTGPSDPLALGQAVSATLTGSGSARQVDWGDDIVSSEVGDVVTHTYAAAGVYTLRCSADDLDGNRQESSYRYVVVYDPAGGFVTGGGWFQSPAGAYIDPSVTGKATFGFVSRYAKGATVPTGNTEFHLEAAGLRFHSESYHWLVISGSKAQYKGVGSLNGVTGYGFLVSAVDGGKSAPDQLRVKIWDRGTGTVVYDNQRGDTDDTAANTVIGGGQIRVHR